MVKFDKHISFITLLCVLVSVFLVDVQAYSVKITMDTKSQTSINSTIVDVSKCSCNLHPTICDNFCCCDNSCSSVIYLIY